MSSAGQGFGEGFFYTPEDQAQQQALRRRQAYAQALMQGQRHEGRYGGLADAGNSIAGALIGRSADRQAADLAKTSQERYATGLAALLKGGSGASPQVSNSPDSPQASPQAAIQGEGMEGPGAPSQVQAQPVAPQQQPQDFASRLAATGNPQLMYQFGPMLAQNQFNRENKVWENENIGLSKAQREQSGLQLQNQEDLSRFNNQLDPTKQQQAELALQRGTQAETRRHNLVGETIAANPFGTGLGVPGAQGKTGDDFLASLPPGVAAQIKAVGTYRQPAPAGRTSPTGIKFMTLVNQAYPTYDASQYGAKVKARNDFTTGKNGNTVRSLNVAVQHLDQLGQLSDAMANGNVQMVNKIGNYIASQTGNPAPSNFNAARQIVGDEIVKAIVGAGGGVSDREEAAHNISAASSPQQLAGVIKTYQGLLSGQLSGLKQQYEKNTGLNDFEDFLAPETKAKLQAHQQPADGAAPGGSPVPGGSGNPGAVPPAAQRKIGQTYPTPRGPLKWNGNGWLAP